MRLCRADGRAGGQRVSNFMEFTRALDIATGVFDRYREERPKWYRLIDGTPIINDLGVRMAEALSRRDAERARYRVRCGRCL